jgi:hypothetical protein
VKTKTMAAIENMSAGDVHRFWSKVATPSADGACRVWIGSLTFSGYGQIRLRPEIGAMAHRVAWFLAHGSLPGPGLVLDHLCHERRCVEVKHLRVATPKQNQENRAGAQANSKSGVRGVYWNRSNRSWSVQVSHRHVGHFSSIEEASKAAQAARAEMYDGHAACDELATDDPANPRPRCHLHPKEA